MWSIISPKKFLGLLARNTRISPAFHVRVWLRETANPSLSTVIQAGGTFFLAFASVSAKCHLMLLFYAILLGSLEWSYGHQEITQIQKPVQLPTTGENHGCPSQWRSQAGAHWGTCPSNWRLCPTSAGAPENNLSSLCPRLDKGGFTVASRWEK